MSTSSSSLILVTGATGAQGGATARELLAAGYQVRFLTRNPDTFAAQSLISLGAEVAVGDLEDASSISAAMRDVYGVFSVQVPDVANTDAERRHGRALIDAALAAQVVHFVHTSVCEAGNHVRFPHWETGYWSKKYWTDKWDVEEAVRNAGFQYWTILKPAFMMDNFAQPKARYMFPHLQQGKVLTALLPTTRMQMIAADDVGVVARAAFSAPAFFDRKNLDLASAALTMEEVTSDLSRLLQKSVSAQTLTPSEAEAAGLSAGWVRSQEWTNEVGYRADISAVQAELGKHDITLTPFARWVQKHARDIHINI